MKDGPQFPADLAEEIMEQINISIKYEGYIRRQEKQVEQFRKLEKKRIPDDIDYDQVKKPAYRGGPEAEGIPSGVHRTGFQDLRSLPGRHIGIVNIPGRGIWKGQIT